MTNTKEYADEFFLKMNFRKSIGKTDDDGNYIFEVEASNENIDLQGQVVLQNALLNSKEHFLRNGVVSFDHLHKRKDENGKTISDPEMIIGEPLEVRTEGEKTIVRGKLYKSNKIAQDIIQKLKDKSTRIKASVGGIFPDIVKERGVEKIVGVLWNDLALTFGPVNATVGSAIFAKSMTADEFVKALAAGSGIDSTHFTGGRALVPEQIGETIDVTEESAIQRYIASVIAALTTGEITGKKEALAFLKAKGLNTDIARSIVREIEYFTEENK